MLKISFDYLDENGKQTFHRCGPITSVTTTHFHIFDETHGEPRCFKRYNVTNVLFYTDSNDLVEFIKENS